LAHGAKINEKSFKNSENRRGRACPYPFKNAGITQYEKII